MLLNQLYLDHKLLLQYLLFMFTSFFKPFIIHLNLKWYLNILAGLKGFKKQLKGLMLQNLALYRCLFQSLTVSHCHHQSVFLCQTMCKVHVLFIALLAFLPWVAIFLPLRAFLSVSESFQVLCTIGNNTIKG